MKEGQLFINVVNDRPVVLVDSQVRTMEYGKVSSNWVKVLTENGKIVPIEVKLLRSPSGKKKN